LRLRRNQVSSSQSVGCLPLENLFSRSLLPIVLAAWHICRIASSSLRIQRIILPAQTCNIRTRVNYLKFSVSPFNATQLKVNFRITFTVQCTELTMELITASMIQEWAIGPASYATARDLNGVTPGNRLVKFADHTNKHRQLTYGI